MSTGMEKTAGALSGDTKALMMYEANKKSLGVGYLLWIFLGVFGGHRFYLRRTGSAVAILILWILGWVLIAAVVGAFLLIIVGMWVLVDAFLIPGWVRAHNNALASQLGQGATVMVL